MRIKFKTMNKLHLFITATLLIFAVACHEGKKENKTVNITDAKIKLYKNKIDQDPSNYNNYDNLAHNYIQKARETGNSSYYIEAEKMLKKSLEINSDNYVGILLFAKTKLSNHEFIEALSFAKTAVELKPGIIPAYGILGDAYLELHDLSKAEKAYKKMIGLNPSLDSYSRMSNLMLHKHNHAEAIKYMEIAYESGLRNSSTPKENLAWTQVMIGSIYLDSGMFTEAENYFYKALEIFDGYYLAIEHLREAEYLK